MTPLPRATRRAAIATVLLTAAAGACSGSDANPSFQERDSARVTIAESTAPSWGDSTLWVVAATPTLDLAASGSGPAHELFRVRDATRLPDGRFAVANSGTNEIRLFDAEGRALGVLGGEGEGPGEFRQLVSVHRYRGDSLIALDTRLQRLTVFSGDGAFGRTSALTGMEGQPNELHVTGDGELLLRVADLDAMDGVNGRLRVPSPVVRVSAEGSGSGEVARLAGFETHSFDRGDALPPYAHNSYAAATEELLFVGDAIDMELRAYALDGRLRRIVRVPGYDLSVPQSERDSLRAAMLAQELPDFLRATQEEMANSIPAVHPAYSGLTVDSEGFVWVARYRSSAALSPEPREWIVFTPDGEWLGTVALPPNFDLYEVGDDYVLGRSRDPLGVETVQMLGLKRR